MVFTEGVADAIETKDIPALNLLLGPVATNAKAEDVVVFDQDGNSIFQLTRRDISATFEYDSTSPLEVADWPGVQRVLASNADNLGDKFVDVVRLGTEHVFYTSAPVFDLGEDGKLVGGIGIGISAAELTRRISNQALSDVILFKPDGTVLNSTFRSVDNNYFTLSTAKAVEILTAIQNDTHYLEKRQINEVSYQFFYTTFKIRSEEIGLMAVALPANFVADQIGLSRNTFAILFLALFLGVWGLGLIVARSISRPVQRLVDTTRAIRSGDLSKRVGLRTPDELGELSLSFDHMTAQLVKRNRRINKLYARQLEETARREAILTSISDAVIVLNAPGKISLLNPTAWSLINSLSTNEDERQTFVAMCRNPDNLNAPQSISFDDHHYSVLATPVNMPSGELLGHVIVFRDITAIIEAERIKDEMIRQLSHELRTPLAAARGYAELALKLNAEQLDPQRGKFIDNTVSQLDVLTRMINQVIDVSSIITGNLSIDVSSFDLKELLFDVVREQKSFIDERQLDIRVFMPKNSHNACIEGDQVRLANVLEHILRNAYSYTLPGGWIEVKLMINELKAIVAVEDSGVGIAPDEMDRVFERMYRGESANAGPTDSRGLGLGLYISKHIVDAHYGKISLESQVEVGTNVTVELPRFQR